MQYVGRCLRIDPDNPDKTAYVLDLSGNVERFGRVEDVMLGKQKKISQYGNAFYTDVITYKDNDGKRNVWERVS